MRKKWEWRARGQRLKALGAEATEREGGCGQVGLLTAAQPRLSGRRVLRWGQGRSGAGGHVDATILLCGSLCVTANSTGDLGTAKYSLRDNACLESQHIQESIKQRTADLP
jgi:hypothetical protein